MLLNKHAFWGGLFTHMPKWLFHTFLFKILTLLPQCSILADDLLFLMRHLEQSEENFQRSSTSCLLISIIFPYIAFPPEWNIRALVESPSLHMCGRCYLISLSAPAMSPLCCFQRQICMPLHYSLHHTNILLFLPSKTTTTNFYWSSSPPIYHVFFTPFAKKLIEGVVYTPCLQFHFSHSLFADFTYFFKDFFMWTIFKSLYWICYNTFSVFFFLVPSHVGS